MIAPNQEGSQKNAEEATHPNNKQPILISFSMHVFTRFEDKALRYAEESMKSSEESCVGLEIKMS